MSSLTHEAQLEAEETVTQDTAGREARCSASSSRVGVGRFCREGLPREDKLTPQQQDLLLRVGLLLSEVRRDPARAAGHWGLRVYLLPPCSEGMGFCGG